jgi:hypothetical protein
LNAFKTVDPLLPLRSLSTDVHHAEVHLTKFEKGFRNSSGPQTGLQHILIVREPARREYPIKGVEKAGSMSTDAIMQHENTRTH